MESLYGKNPAKYVHLWGPSPQGNIFLVKKRRSVLHYYKNPEPSENKIRIIYLSSNTLELWKFSNLTFKGSLAGTTPVLSIGFFFFFVVQILFRAREDCATYWRFSTSSVGAVCGKEHSRAILPLPGQKVVWYSLARSRPTTTTEMNHALLPLKDRYRPLPLLWSALLGKITT